MSLLGQRNNQGLTVSLQDRFKVGWFLVVSWDLLNMKMMKDQELCNSSSVNAF